MCRLLLCRLLSRLLLLGLVCSNLLLQVLCPIQPVLVRPPDHLGVGTVEAELGLSLQHFREHVKVCVGLLVLAKEPIKLLRCSLPKCSLLPSLLMYLRYWLQLVVDHPTDRSDVHAGRDAFGEERNLVAFALHLLDQIL